MKIMIIYTTGLFVYIHTYINIYTYIYMYSANGEFSHILTVVYPQTILSDHH